MMNFKEEYAALYNSHSVLERENAALHRKLDEMRGGLVIAILWACNSDGGFHEATKRFYDWATAEKEKIPGNPHLYLMLDKAIKSAALSTDGEMKEGEV